MLVIVSENQNLLQIYRCLGTVSVSMLVVLAKANTVHESLIRNCYYEHTIDFFRKVDRKCSCYIYLH